MEGAGRYLCLLVFHNRNDDLSRNAFGCLMTQLLVTAQLLPSDSVAGLFAKLQESWINAVSNGNAAVDAMNSSPRGLRVLRVAFYPSDLSGDDPLASLGGVQEQVKKLQSFIIDHFYKCSNEMLFGLGKMYDGGGDFTNNIDKMGGEGTAEFIFRAIKIYCGR